jgi:hypothetical protein
VRIRFQADADFNEDIVAGALRRLPEIDFQTANEAKLARLSDFEVLAKAAAEGRILITHDRKLCHFISADLSRYTAARASSLFLRKLSC